MSYEGQAHHPHRRGYPPSPDLLLASQSTVPPSLQLVQAHWFVRHGERAPVRQRMVGLGEIPAVFELCSVGRQFSTAVLSLAPQTPSQPLSTSSSLHSSPVPTHPFLSSSRHTTTLGSPPSSSPQGAPVDPTPRQMSVTRFTEDVPTSASSSSKPTKGGLRDCYWGELTDLGRESTLRFGSILRSLYVLNPLSSSTTSFLPSSPLDSSLFEKGIVQFRSTNMPRTIESLHQIIEGLFETSRSPSNLRIPFRVRNWMDENLYPNTACKNLRFLDAASIQRAAKLYNPGLEKLDERLIPVLGKALRVDSSPRANGVLDTLMVCRAHGIKVPGVFEDKEVLETLEKGVVHEWFDGYLNPEFRRLAMGRLFSDLHSHLSSKITNPLEDALKLSINSCHDTSIGGILNALNAFNDRWPPFTSHLGIELYKTVDPSTPTPSTSSTITNDSKSLNSRLTSLLPSSKPSSSSKSPHFVRVLFNGKPLVLPGCSKVGDHLEGTEGSVCIWEAFEKVLNEVKIGEDEWKEACGTD